MYVVGLRTMMLRKTRKKLTLVSFLSGSNGGFARNDWFTAIGFSFLVSMTLYLILDLDISRMGQINLDDQQKRLIDFYHSTKWG